MTGRERILAALSPAGTAETPAVICYPGIFERDHLGELTGLPWWHLHAAEPAMHAAIQAEIVRATALDWFEVRAGASREEQAAVSLVEEAGAIIQRDARTGARRRLDPPVVSGTLSTVQADAPEIADVEAFLTTHVPTPTPFTGIEDGRGDYPALLRAALSEHCPLAWAGTPQWLLAGTMGYAEWFAWLAHDPVPLERACARLLEAGIAGVRASAALGARVIWIEDCMTDQIGPERFRRYHLPFLRAFTDAIRAEGLSSIHYFCGNPWPYFDQLLDTGADALGLEESKKTFRIDIDDVVDRVAGRMAVLGNLDAIAVLEHGSDAALQAEVTRQLAAGRRNGGRFLMSTGSPVTPGTPAARVRAYGAMVRRLAGGV
jgi:hypothetical protein